LTAWRGATIVAPWRCWLTPGKRDFHRPVEGKGEVGGYSSRLTSSSMRYKSGVASDTDLLEYALAKVALEDEFGAELVRRKGRITQDFDLEL
jgi:hypothetical protein